MRYEQIEGQLSLFEEPKSLFHEPKEEELINPIFEELIERYRYTCTRIAKVEKKLYIEIDGKTLAFKENGEAAGIFIKDMLLRPKDEIIVSNEYKPITTEQIRTIKSKMQTDKFIKRKSDSNILIQYESYCMAIYPDGKFAKWKSPAVFLDNELYDIDELDNINKLFQEIVEDPKKNDITKHVEELKLGDKVTFDYDGPKIGEIVRIYNSGETVNVCWDNRQTAFYYKHVYKITG